jgi:peptidyl-prolyl cis-trans isomerase SDCCAG10
MSYAYTNQPSTKGKIIIKTSAGDLEVELWSKEAPKSCRNFVQLCMEGYYDDCPIHRIVPNFIVQTGDPTGTGFGGESIYGKDFDDEFHSRLRFTQRGLLAMANTGRHSNKSQFFFTLAATPELNGKNTIFAKVVGDTVFNLLKLGELQTDKDERPIYKAKIITTVIIANPFDDIEPRTTREERAKLKEEQEMKIKEAAERSKPKGTKKMTLLSFGNDEETNAPIPNQKIKSSHDLLDSEMLSKQQVETNHVSESKKPSKRKATSPAIESEVIAAKNMKSSTDKDTPSQTNTKS